mmetsp:Transcript_113089/g.241381  ORF Transcript_113089/g.241381 Transcript_113089/m.241381 type:complete len:319 (-) Transcript_113089:137-1093(-)
MAWTGGKGGWYGSRPPPTVAEDFEISADAKFSGTVVNYYKWHGYGFITVDQQGIIPQDKLYVHWSNIQTQDRYPFLVKDQKVEFGVMKWKTRGGTTLRAKTVTNPGGQVVANQDAIDAEKKTFVGSQQLRYTGMLKFYNPARGFGYVAMDDGYQLDEPVPKELRVELSEVNCGGKRPQRMMENTPVEFGIVKNKAGHFLAYNMTMPGGVPLLTENLEGRQVLQGQIYKGVITNYNWKQGWGFIAVDASVPLPPAVQQKIVEMQESAKARGKTVQEGAVLYFRKPDIDRALKADKDVKVRFQLYVDSKGAGACDVVEDA